MAIESFAWNRRKLRAAIWILKLVGTSGLPLVELKHSWAVLPVGGEVDIDDFEATLSVLRESALVMDSSGVLVAAPGLYEVASTNSDGAEELLYGEILNRITPLWLSVATNDGNARSISYEFMPDEVALGLQSIIEDPLRREGFLLARGRKVKPEELTALGEAAEIAAVNALRDQLTTAGKPDLASVVSRVSLISDELGYDITAPRLDGSTRRIEVKGVRSHGRSVSVVVTSNEMTIGFSDPNWFLMVVEIAAEASILGWVAAKSLEPLMPADRHRYGRWTAARLRFPAQCLEAGLPPIAC